MTNYALTSRQTATFALWAGLLYLTVIVFGVTSEMALRAPLYVAGDAPATALRLTDNLPLYRLSLTMDAVMVLCDIGLAVLFFVLLRPVQPTLALAAMVLRLMQGAVISGTLLFQLAAALMIDTAPHLVYGFMQVQSHGYDLGLIFFGAGSLIMAYLLCHSGLVPRWLPPLMAGAGMVYLAGSFTRLLAPELNAALQPAYLLPLVAESALCLILLIRGLRPRPGTLPAAV
jgi:hypothetical protein